MNDHFSKALFPSPDLSSAVLKISNLMRFAKKLLRTAISLAIFSVEQVINQSEFGLF